MQRISWSPAEETAYQERDAAYEGFDAALTRLMAMMPKEGRGLLCDLETFASERLLAHEGLLKARLVRMAPRVKEIIEYAFDGEHDIDEVAAATC